jgi:hypothetical protein
MILMAKTWAYVLIIIGVFSMFTNAYEAWNYHNISKFELNSSNEMIDQWREIDNPQLKDVAWQSVERIHAYAMEARRRSYSALGDMFIGFFIVMLGKYFLDKS